jgi:dCTP diphosphatase
MDTNNNLSGKLSLDALTKLVVNFRNERNWKQFHTPKDMLLSLMIEVSELAEHLQFKSAAELESYLKTDNKEVGHELSDILYWVLLLAHDFGVDLDSAFKEKMAINIGKYPVDKALGNNAKYTEL